MKKLSILILFLTAITCFGEVSIVTINQASMPFQINQGGTGGTTAEAARTALGVLSTSEVQAAISSNAYNVTTPIVVQKASIGTTTAGLAGEIVTPNLIINASGAVQTRGIGTGSTIGNARGSGATDLQNYRTVSYEVAGAGASVIAGGGKNTITSAGDWSAIGGGYINYIGSARSTIAGGEENNIGVNAIDSTIAGGYRGTISGTGYSSILGGYDNDILTTVYSNIGGGYQNKIDSSSYSSISGGYQNQAKTYPYQLIGGGYGNISEGTGTAIISGNGNTASGQWSIIAGGGANKISDGSNSFIGAGDTNTVSVGSSFIGAGHNNIVSTNGYSFAGAGQHNTVKAMYAGILSGAYNTLDGGWYNMILGGDHNVIYAAGGEGSNMIGAGSENSIGAVCYYGGILAGYKNSIYGLSSYNFIGGGRENKVASEGSAVVSGYQNSASGPWSIVVGGYNNKINAVGASGSTIIGGSGNTLTGAYSGALGTGNTISGDGNFIYGVSNSNSGGSSFVGGNSCSNNQTYGIVACGLSNVNTGQVGAILGGRSNQIAGNYGGFIGGGYNNRIAVGVTNVYRSENCFIPGGNGAQAAQVGQFAHAAMPFATQGDSQHSILINSAITTDENSTSMSQNRGRDFEGNSFPSFINYIATGSSWVGDIKINAVSSDTNRLTWGSIFRFKIDHSPTGNINISTGTTEIFADIGLEGCYINLESVIASSAWRINVVGSSTTNIRWTAIIDYAETRWP